MSHSIKWVPANTPLDEGYWEALLRDSKGGAAAPRTGGDIGYARDVANRAESPSARAAEMVDWWAEAARALDRGDILELLVIGCNRGGVLVEWGNLDGFVPASRLMGLSVHGDDGLRREELRGLIGSRLCLKVIEVDAGHERLVLSERAVDQDIDAHHSVLDALVPGEVYRGTVTKLCSFGAFVDLGGVEGLIHISELAWGRVEHTGDVLEPGQSVEVFVLNVDRDRGRVGLSLKRLQPDPWQTVGDRYWSGQVVDGVVTSVVDFGAFVRVEEGLEGLLHVSQLADADMVDPSSVVHEGDRVSVRVLNVDAHQRRMALGLLHG